MNQVSRLSVNASNIGTSAPKGTIWERDALMACARCRTLRLSDAGSPELSERFILTAWSRLKWGIPAYVHILP